MVVQYKNLVDQIESICFDYIYNQQTGFNYCAEIHRTFSDEFDNVSNVLARLRLFIYLILILQRTHYVEKLFPL